MAFSTKRVWANSDAPFLPSGHSVSITPASIGTVDITNRGVTLTLAASGSVTTTAAAGADALLKTALVTALDTLVGTTMGVDTTTYTVSYNAQVLSVEPAGGDNDKYLNDATRTFTIKLHLSVSVVAA